MKCPVSLGTDAQMVLNYNLECGHYKVVDHIICKRKLYDCDGVFVYLPPYSPSEIKKLYSHYDGQSKLSSTSARPVEQSKFISANVPNVSNMSIHEFGCAAAHLLIKLRNIYKPAYTICNDNAHYANRDTAIIFNQEMSFDSVLTNSVDLFVSSHVVEHVSPDDWFPHLRRIVKPGGFVFTEVPNQRNDHFRKIVRGKYHVAFYNGTTFDATMRRSGFVGIASSFKDTRWIHQRKF